MHRQIDHYKWMNHVKNNVIEVEGKTTQFITYNPNETIEYKPIMSL